MSPREKRRSKLFDRNALIVLLVALIIIAATYYILTRPPGESINALSPDEVIENSEDYIDQNITVQGYYKNEGDVGTGVITSKIIGPDSTFEDYSGSILPVDHSSKELWNYSFVDTATYQFTGVLISETYTVVLVAEKIVAV